MRLTAARLGVLYHASENSHYPSFDDSATPKKPRLVCDRDKLTLYCKVSLSFGSVVMQQPTSRRSELLSRCLILLAPLTIERILSGQFDSDLLIRSADALHWS